MIVDQVNESLQNLKKAFRIFEEQEDEILMLLTARQLLNFTNAYPGCLPENELEELHHIFNNLKSLRSFQDINLDILFSNFDKRIKLAKLVKKFFFIFFYKNFYFIYFFI